MALLHEFDSILNYQVFEEVRAVNDVHLLKCFWKALAKIPLQVQRVLQRVSIDIDKSWPNVCSAAEIETNHESIVAVRGPESGVSSLDMACSDQVVEPMSRLNAEMTILVREA